MNRRSIYLAYYSQSGECELVARAIENDLKLSNQIVNEKINSIPDFKFPWTLTSFFSVMPETVKHWRKPLRSLAPLNTDKFRAELHDTLILIYPVWFLSPCIPMQVFINELSQSDLIGKKVIVIAVAREMFICAQHITKALLLSKGAAGVIQFHLLHRGAFRLRSLVITPWNLIGKRRGGRNSKLASLSPSDCDEIVQKVRQVCKNQEIDNGPKYSRSILATEIWARIAFEKFAKMVRVTSPDPPYFCSLFLTLIVPLLVLTLLVSLPLLRMTDRMTGYFSEKVLSLWVDSLR